MQSSDAPGASVAGTAGMQTSPGSFGSLTVTPVSVTLPVFVAVSVYTILSPASARSSGGTTVMSSTPVFASASAGTCGSGTVAVASVGGVWALSAVAVFATGPAFRSAWVSV